MAKRLTLTIEAADAESVANAMRALAFEIGANGDAAGQMRCSGLHDSEACGPWEYRYEVTDVGEVQHKAAEGRDV